MRRALRLFSRRYPWQQHSFPMTSIRDRVPGQCQAHSVSTASRQTNPSQHLFSSVRFYSQGAPNEVKVLPPRITELLNSEIQPDEEATSKASCPYMDSLMLCASPSDVLDLTTKYSPTVRQISKSLTRMWVTTKVMSYEQLRCELQLMSDHPAFDKLLQRAMQDVGLMSNEDVAYSLIAMVRLGVPQQSRVIHTFLRACQKNLNSFDEKGLSLLASCLEYMESSPNVEALKKGLRFIVDARLSEIQNVMALQVMMRVMGRDSPRELKKKLERKALSMTDQFTLANTQYMFFTMATMGFYSKPLLDICSKKFKEDLSGTTFNQLLKVLRSCHQLHYRDLDLLNDISEYSASMIDIWTTKQAVLLLPELEKLYFSPDALLDVFAAKVIAKPDVLTLQELLCILKVYTSLNYDLQNQRQQFLDSISQALVSYLPNMNKHQLLNAVFNLCKLGHYPPALLEHLLLEISPEEFELKEPKLMLGVKRIFHTVSLCLLLDRPPLPQPLTVHPSLIMEPVDPTGLKVDEWLSESLRTVLADQTETTLEEMVVEEDFYVIDAVITKPLPEQDSNSDSPSESSQRLAVICASPSSFCCGTSRPRSGLAVKIRHLKVLGYESIVLNKKQLTSVSEEERVEFLRKRIFPEQYRSDSQQES